MESTFTIGLYEIVGKRIEESCEEYAEEGLLWHPDWVGGSRQSDTIWEWIRSARYPIYDEIRSEKRSNLRGDPIRARSKG